MVYYNKELDVPVVHTYAELGLPIIYAESYQQRLERLLEFQDKNHKTANVIAVRERPESNYVVKDQFVGANQVVNDGEVAYAQKSAGESPTNDFWHATAPRWEVRTGTALTPADTDTWTQFTNPVAGSLKARTAGYPKTNDTGDADNTGDSTQAVSWAVNWATTDFNTTNISGVIYTSVTSPTTGSPLLFHAVYSPAFDKASTDTLKTFVNHTFESA